MSKVTDKDVNIFSMYIFLSKWNLFYGIFSKILHFFLIISKYCHDQVKKFYQREIIIVRKALMSSSHLQYANILLYLLDFMLNQQHGIQILSFLTMRKKRFFSRKRDHFERNCVMICFINFTVSNFKNIH